MPYTPPKLQAMFGQRRTTMIQWRPAVDSRLGVSGRLHLLTDRKKKKNCNHKGTTSVVLCVRPLQQSTEVIVNVLLCQWKMCKRFCLVRRFVEKYFLLFPLRLEISQDCWHTEGQFTDYTHFLLL